MGCFSKTIPTYTPPAPPKLPTADELFASGTNYAKTNDPLAYGAREGALSDLQNPMAYYSSFQPTSFEQALGNQSFQNVWPDTQAYMANVLSKSGMAYSPVAAATMGKEYGNLSQSIGQYLSDQANNRANSSLNARLGIDPMSMVSPFVNVGVSQGNAQADLNYNYQQQLAQAAYQQALQKQKQSQGMFGSLGTLGGAALGALLAAPTGGMSLGMGAMLGSMGGSAVAPLFGGSSNPGAMSSLGNMAVMSQIPGMSGMFGGSTGAGTGVNGVGNFASKNMDVGANLGGAQPATLPIF